MNVFREATTLGTGRYNRDGVLSIRSELICRFRLSEEGKATQDVLETTATSGKIKVAQEILDHSHLRRL